MVVQCRRPSPSERTARFAQFWANGIPGYPKIQWLLIMPPIRNCHLGVKSDCFRDICTIEAHSKTSCLDHRSDPPKSGESLRKVRQVRVVNCLPRPGANGGLGLAVIYWIQLPLWQTPTDLTWFDVIPTDWFPETWSTIFHPMHRFQASQWMLKWMQMVWYGMVSTSCESGESREREYEYATAGSKAAHTQTLAIEPSCGRNSAHQLESWAARTRVQ